MKFCRILLSVLFFFIYIGLNAQVFVGGSVRFNTSNSDNNRITPVTKVSNYNLDLSPSVGKFLSEKLAIGLALDITLSGNKTGVNAETISKSSGIGINPFLRYYAIKWNKFSVFGQGNIDIAFSNSSLKTDGIVTDGPKVTRFSIGVNSGLSYDASEKLSLLTSLNILSFGYNYVITKDGSTKDKISNFNIGAGLGNIVSVGAITIGAIFKF
jgi:outer membrane protein